MQKPNLTRQELILKLSGLTLPSVSAMIVGIRGYYKNSMGKPDENDRGIYDDAMFIITPDSFYSFNGNTDPSKFQNGIAVLQPGIYEYAKGLHGISHLNLSNPNDKKIFDELNSTGKDVPGFTKTYWAFRQHSNVTVKRDGGNIETDSPAHRFWIDLHRGGEWTTSSLGCQTIILDEWEEFRTIGYAAMDKYQQNTIPYILIEN